MKAATEETRITLSPSSLSRPGRKSFSKEKSRSKVHVHDPVSVLDPDIFKVLLGSDASVANQDVYEAQL